MFLTNVNEEYLKTINNLDLLQELLLEKQKENQKQIFLKKYEINRLVEEQKYILDEIEMQKTLLKKNDKFCKKIVYKYKKLEFELTGLLIKLFKIKEDFLMKRVVFHSLKSEFDRIYKQNQNNLTRILKREEQIKTVKDQIEQLKVDKEQKIALLAAKAQEKDQKSNVVDFNDKINEDILDLNKSLFMLKENYQKIRTEKEKQNIKLKILIKKFTENKTRLMDQAIKLKKKKFGSTVDLKGELVREIAKKIFYIRKNRRIEKQMKQLNLLKIQNTNQRVEEVFSDQLFQLFILKNKIKIRRQIFEKLKTDSESFSSKKPKKKPEEEEEVEGEDDEKEKEEEKEEKEEEEEQEDIERRTFKEKIIKKLESDRFITNEEYLRSILEFTHTAKLEHMFMKQVKKERSNLSSHSGGGGKEDGGKEDDDDDDDGVLDKDLNPFRQNVKLNFLNDLKEKLTVSTSTGN